MRAMWKGAISFGLLNIPVKMSTATQKKTISFHTLHEECHTPIKQRRFCPRCKEEVPYEKTLKGYPYQGDTYVIITPDDLASLPLKTTKTIDILDFIQLNEIDPIYFHKTYYLTPQEGGEKPYFILKEVMEEKGRVAVTKITIRQKESLAIIRIIGDVLGLETIFYGEEIRQTEDLEIEELKKKITIHPREKEMALQLVDNLTTRFEPEEYKDDYREALLEVIRRKVDGEEIERVTPHREERGQVVDIMEKLKASLEETEAKKKVKSY